LGGAYVAMSIPALMMHPLATVLIGALLTIGSFIGVQFMRPIRVEENILGNYLLKTQNPISRILLYSLGVTSLGLSASPLFAYISMISPNIIASSLAITLGIFGGASIMAYAMPKDKMLGYGRVLTGSLLGLIGLQLFGLGTAYFMGGPNTLTYLLFSLDNYAGILLFSALIAYDTHVAIKIY
jgi:FtsH-binding integral membrane protein